MITFIQKLIFLLKKKNHLTQVRCERNYVANNFKEKLNTDTDELRSELAVLKNKKVKSTKEKEKMAELENNVNEIEYYKGMIKKSELTEMELLGIIRETKKFLWKNK